MALEIRALSPAAGAEVAGLDLREPIDDATRHALVAAWHAHYVLVIRDQDISIDDQRRFVSCFGELQPTRSRPGQRANPDILYVANVPIEGEIGELPEGDMQFHADQCYYETPTKGAVLYAQEVPASGGNTLFCNTGRAYETLPPELRARIDDLDVLFAYDYQKNAYHRPTTTLPDGPRAVHPAVIAHPATGLPKLFVNRLMTDSLVGLPRAESDALLQRLFDHMERPEMIYEHVWRPGDVVIWDNLAVAHARTDFDPAERRRLRRMAIRGTRLAAFKPRRTAA